MSPDFGLTPEYLTQVKDWEGFRPKPYQDIAKYWTIGYGHRCDPDHPPITEPQGAEILMADLRPARDKALLWSPGLADEPERRMSAITDFVFNAGAGNYMGSTLKQMVNEKKWADAAAQMRRWVHAHDQKTGMVILVEALVRRRGVTAQWLEEG